MISWLEVLELFANVCDELLEESDGVGEEDLLLLSARKELDFLMIAAGSFFIAPFSVTSSCAKFLTARDSGFGFKVDVPVNVCWGGVIPIPEEIPSGGNDDIIEEEFCSSSACSGPSSGMVG